MANCESVTAAELGQLLDRDEKSASTLRKGQCFEEKQGQLWEAHLQQIKKEKYTKEERGRWQRNVTVLQFFITVTPNETGNATVAYFSGDLNKENLEKVFLNDIPANACRIKIVGKDPVA